MNEQQYGETILALAEMAGKKCNSLMLQFYLDELSNYDSEDAEKALRHFFTLGKFPTIVEIRSFFGKRTLDPKERAKAIMSMIEDAIRKYGYCNEEKALATLPKEALDLIAIRGGWSVLCNIPDEQTWSYTKHDMTELLRIRIESKKEIEQTLLPEKRETQGQLSERPEHKGISAPLAKAFALIAGEKK